MSGTLKSPYTPPLSFARLRAIMGEVAAGGELSATTRVEIGIALHLLYAKLAVESDQHAKGGREAAATRGIALAMHWLIEHKQAGKQDAAATVLFAEFPNSTAKEVGAACKMYDNMKQAHEFDALMDKLDPVYMEKLAAALPKPRSRKE